MALLGQLLSARAPEAMSPKPPAANAAAKAPTWRRLKFFFSVMFVSMDATSLVTSVGNARFS
jgi:hypothetical protein